MKLKACLLLLMLALTPCLFGGGKVYKGKIVGEDGVEKDGTIINVVCFSLPNATGCREAEIIPNEPGQVMLPRETISLQAPVYI